jgi:hypothetical protein
MRLDVAATGYVCRLAAVVVLGGMAAYGALIAARAAETGVQPSVEALPSSRIELKGSVPGDRKPYTRVAQVFDDEDPGDERDDDWRDEDGREDDGRAGDWREDDEDEERLGDERVDGDDDRSPFVTYRTLCVRLCDGYYFPISFATPHERLAGDARACENRCGAMARLFIYANPGGDVAEMTDLEGTTYTKLPTAFLYRTEYIPSCKCQPHPWEAEARQRHHGYALIAAAKKLPAPRAGKPPGRKADTGNGLKRGRTAPSAKPKVAASADADMMRLGRKRGRPSSPRPWKDVSDGDWRKRVFQAN